MDYDLFLNRLRRVLEADLPGVEAHQEMLPRDRKLVSSGGGKKSMRESAVLVLFYLREAQLCMPVIRRAFDGKKHSGQIAFPGGKYEKEDKSLINTSLREAQEEVGIDPEKVEVLKELTPVYIPVSNYRVQPILGVTSEEPTFVPNPEEVDAIFSLQVEEFLKAEPVEKEFLLKEKQLSAPFYVFDDVEIWGATAMIMSELRGILRKVFP